MKVTQWFSISILGIFFNSVLAFGSEDLAARFTACVETPDPKCVEKLIAQGLDPNRGVNFHGNRTPLGAVNLAAMMNTHEKKYPENSYVKIADILLKNGAYLTDYDTLYYIVSSGCAELVELYLKSGLPASMRLEGSSLIEISTSQGHKKLSDVLIKFGANSISSSKGITLQLVQTAGRLHYEDNAKLNSLLEMGADINGKGSKGVTPLGALVGYPLIDESESAILYLLDRGANPNIMSNPDLKGFPEQTYPINIIIMWCGKKVGNDRSAEKQFLYEKVLKRILNVMLEKGLRVAAKDIAGRTPLHYAALYDSPVAIKILLEKGAKKTDKDKDGMMPYDLAESSEVISLLQ